MTDLFDDWIYETNADNSARFMLGEKGEKPLVCIGVNPSTATPEKLDNTLRRVKKFSETLGYDGWLMLNLYPQRATNPDMLHLERDAKLHLESILAIRENFQQINFTVWAAWGCLIEKRTYLINCLLFFANHFAQDRWITVGKLTQHGHPRHPLYLPGSAEVQDFNVNEYLRNNP